ncbi:MAG: GntR family transcriptional regulator [Clostridia bacterium]|nr:GntR family transcriptional regulator [Clostridia bacterium]
MVHLDYRDARPIYTQITDGFREQILAGVLQAGDKLPSVRELATELTINPNTIQRAYRELESQGWIASVPGKGSFVQGVPQADPAQTQALLTEFDKLTATLLAMGLTEQELAARIRKGGNSHA